MFRIREGHHKEYVLIPLVIYFICFYLLTYPLIHQFSTHFFSDKGDGLLHIWNIWWVNKAVTQLHQSPWQTTYLHYPYGVSLFGHTLNPFNGFLAIPLLRFFTLIQVHNSIVIFSFLMAGLTVFWLVYYLTKAYWPSIIAGFIFTFCQYHFAHAEGHLNLLSLEWLPLFIFFWYKFLRNPGIFPAISSGLTLFLILLCDYYYFFCAVAAAVIMYIWQARQRQDISFLFRRSNLVPICSFIFLVLLSAGPWIISFLLLSLKEPLIGSPLHKNSLDVLAAFIPGGHWRFASLTKFYWLRLPGNIHENSVSLGLGIIFLLIYVWVKRREAGLKSLALWYFMLLFFWVMSLGPALLIWGKEIPYIKLPYAWLKYFYPSFKLSSFSIRLLVMLTLGLAIFFTLSYLNRKRREGRFHGLWFWYLSLSLFLAASLEAVLHLWGCGVLFLELPYAWLERICPFLKSISTPGRMMVMVMLCASLISATGLKMLFQKKGRCRIYAFILLPLLFFEYWPKSMPASRLPIPAYIEILKESPGKEGVLDLVNPANLAGYYQTVHQKPLAFSDISRIPRGTMENDRRLKEFIKDRDFDKIYSEYRIGYVIAGVGLEPGGGKGMLKLIYRDGNIGLYRLTKGREEGFGN